MTRQTKSFKFSVKAVDDAQGLIEAYGSVFDNEDQGGDVVRPGAFKRTIQNSKSRVQAGKAKFLAVMLWQHSPDNPIGGWTDLKEDAHGLLCKGKIILSTPMGSTAYELIKAGVIQEFSIGYDIPQGGMNYDGKSGVRNLTELRLWEVSPVTFAMNQEALLVGVKKDENMPPEKEASKKEKKTLLEHYNEGAAEDLLEDWQDVYVCALTSAVLDAFKIGDTPQTDISDALDAFKELVMSKFVAQGIECGLSQYLTDNTMTYSSADSTMQNGTADAYSQYGGYMSNRRTLARKAGRAVSAANAEKIQGAIDGLHSAADAMKEHTKAVHSAADDLATILQGSEQAYGTDPGDAGDRQEGKSTTTHATSRDRVRGTHSRSQESTVKVGFVTAAGNYVESPPGTPGVAGPLTEEEKRLGREADEVAAALRKIKGLRAAR